MLLVMCCRDAFLTLLLLDDGDYVGIWIAKMVGT